MSCRFPESPTSEKSSRAGVSREYSETRDSVPRNRQSISWQEFRKREHLRKKSPDKFYLNKNEFHRAIRLSHRKHHVCKRRREPDRALVRRSKIRSRYALRDNARRKGHADFLFRKKMAGHLLFGKGSGFYASPENQGIRFQETRFGNHAGNSVRPFDNLWRNRPRSRSKNEQKIHVRPGCRRSGRSQSDITHHPVPPRPRRNRKAHRLCRRHRTENFPARTRRDSLQAPMTKKRILFRLKLLQSLTLRTENRYAA